MLRFGSMLPEQKECEKTSMGQLNLVTPRRNMSVWFSINAVFMVPKPIDLGPVLDLESELGQKFLKDIHFSSSKQDKAKAFDAYHQWIDSCSLPKGSENSLQYHHKNGKLYVFGSLRDMDFSNFPEIKTWFKDLVQKHSITKGGVVMHYNTSQGVYETKRYIVAQDGKLVHQFKYKNKQHMSM